VILFRRNKSPETVEGQVCRETIISINAKMSRMQTGVRARSSRGKRTGTD
jgi:hypothetical protein